MLFIGLKKIFRIEDGCIQSEAKNQLSILYPDNNIIGLTSYKRFPVVSLNRPQN
jgi:hypothetical protein